MFSYVLIKRKIEKQENRQEIQEKIEKKENEEKEYNGERKDERICSVFLCFD